MKTKLKIGGISTLLCTVLYLLFSIDIALADIDPLYRFEEFDRYDLEYTYDGFEYECEKDFETEEFEYLTQQEIASIGMGTVFSECTEFTVRCCVSYSSESGEADAMISIVSNDILYMSNSITGLFAFNGEEPDFILVLRSVPFDTSIDSTDNSKIALTYCWATELRDCEITENQSRGFVLDRIRGIVKRIIDLFSDSESDTDNGESEVNGGSQSSSVSNPLYNFTLNACRAVFALFKPSITKLCNDATHIAQNYIFGGVRETAEIGASILMMYEDYDENNQPNGIFHADFDCWQSVFGYNDFYDIAFDSGTSMYKYKEKLVLDPSSLSNSSFPSILNTEKTYVIWCWMGNYLNLGAGIEMGIYSKYKQTDFYFVDKTMSRYMEVSLYKEIENDDNLATIVDHWSSNGSPQWWITSFNSNFQNEQRENMIGDFIIEFGDSTETLNPLDNLLYNEFQDVISYGRRNGTQTDWVAIENTRMFRLTMNRNVHQ